MSYLGFGDVGIFHGEYDTGFKASFPVNPSHTGMASHPAVRYAVGDRLAQPEGQ